MQVWQVYMDELRTRGARAAAQKIGRGDALAEAVHDAYRATSDRLTGEHGWDDERALVLLRGFNEAARSWIAGGARDWDSLEVELARLERSR